jgi:uncharacterized protein YprB with RNaseH-like and TPR domain
MRLENTFIGADGVGETTERDLWEQGVTHWDDVEDGVLGGRRGERLREFVEEARPRLAANDADYFAGALPGGCQWRLAENFRGSACFFDIETTGLDEHASVVTTVSCHRDGETTTYVRGRDLTADALRSELDVDVTTPHLDLMYPSRQVDLTGGLKAIEADLGIGRDSDVDGREAVQLWHQYEAGDEGALERLVHYNRLDAENLETLLDAVSDRLHHEVFAPYADG